MTMDKKVLDKSSQMRDNVTNNDLYDVVADKYAVRLDVVKMDEQVPVNDTSCKHETLVPDPDDTLGEAVYHGCANTECGVGFYIKNKKLT